MNTSEKQERETKCGELGINEISKKNNKVDNIDEAVVCDDSSISYSNLNKKEQKKRRIARHRNEKNQSNFENTGINEDSIICRLRSMFWGSCLRHELQEFEHPEKVIVKLSFFSLSLSRKRRIVKSHVLHANYC